MSRSHALVCIILFIAWNGIATSAHADTANCDDLLKQMQHQPDTIHRAYEMLNEIKFGKDEYEKTDDYKKRITMEVQNVNAELEKQFGTRNLGAIVPLNSLSVDYDADKAILQLKNESVSQTKFVSPDFGYEKFLRYISSLPTNENWERYVAAFDDRNNKWLNLDSKISIQMEPGQAKALRDKFAVFAIGPLTYPYFALNMSDAEEEEPFNPHAIGRRLVTRAVIIKPICMGVVNTESWQIFSVQ